MRILVLLLSLIFTSTAFADRTGTIPGSSLTVGDSDNTFPIIYEDEMYGGYRSVANTTERNAITTERRKLGMLVKKLDDGTYWTLTSGLTNADWVEVKLGAGWATTGTSVHLITSSDNVGIGTTAATSKLDVRGVHKVSGSGVSYIDGEHSGIELDALTDGAIRFKSGGEQQNTNNQSLDLNLESQAGKAIWTSTSDIPITEQVWDNKYTIGQLDVALSVGIGAPELPGLISYYKLDETWESTSVLDSEGVNNGTASGNASTFHTEGIVDGAFAFSLNQVNLGAFSGKPVAGDFCVETAIKTSATGAAQRFMGNRLGSGTNVGWELTRLADGKFWFAFDTGVSNPSVTSVSTINTGDWIHLVTCRDNGFGALYVNGTREGSVNTSMTGDIGTGSGNTYLGGTPFSPNEFEGSLDKVRFYNRALTEVEVSSLYQEFLNPPEITAPIISNESLNVGGNVAVNGEIYSTSNVSIGTIDPQVGRLVVIGEGTDDGIAIQTRDSDENPLVTFLDNGRIGIGTLTPKGLIDVNGPSKLTGGFYAGGVEVLPDLEVEDRLIAFYKMEDNAANTTVEDSFGAYDGTSIRNTSVVSTTGKIGNALTFAFASGDIVNLGPSFPKPTTNITIDFWMKSVSTNKGVMGNRSATGNQNGWGILLRSDSKLQFFVDTGTSVLSSIISTTSVNDGNWHHVVAKRNDTELILKIDGEEEGTQLNGLSGDMGTDAGETWIGGYPQAGVSTFQGQLDNVRIYSGLTTNNEDETLYNDGAGTDATSQSSLVNVIGTTTTTADNFVAAGSDLIIQRHLEVQGTPFFECMMGIDTDGLGLTECKTLNGILTCVIDTNGVCGE